MRHLIALLFASISLFSYAQIDWDFPYNPDSDNDGYIYSEDLLDLPAIYGQEYSSDELYLSQDSSSLIVYVGDLDKIKCGAACMNLEGNWSNLSSRDLIKHYDQLAIYPPMPYGNYDDVWMWYSPIESSSGALITTAWQMGSITRSTRTSNDGFDYPAFWQQGNTGVTDSNTLNELECWCVTHQRPRVEYKMLELGSNYEELMIEVEVLSNQGWYLHNSMPHPQSSGTTHFVMWRWAE